MTFVNSIRIRRCVSWFVGLLCLSITLPAPTNLSAAEGEYAKRVLFISTGSRFSIGFPIVEQSTLDRLRQLHPGSLEFYGEYLDLVRFPSASYRRLFRDFLRDKYAYDPPDLVILTYVGNLGLAEKFLEELFPNTPGIAVGLTEEELPAKRSGSRLTGLAQRSDPAGTIELLRRLQPETRRLVLIGGTADVDRHVMNRTKQALRSLGEPLAVEVWDSRSLADILDAVTSLPPQTAILFTRMFRDGTGRATISANAAQSVAKVANAPLYVMTDSMLGSGAIGGSMVDLVSLGKRAGELAHQVLNGADPRSLPLEIITQGVAIFDWRALERWKIPQSRLPQNSIVRFRPVSLWEQYRSYIIAGLIIFTLQTILIVGLLAQRGRRRRAEVELHKSQEMMEMATTAGGLGLWARDIPSDTVWVNPVLRSVLGLGENEPFRTRDLLDRIHPEDRARINDEVQRAQDENLPFEGEFRTVLPDNTERWILAKGSTVNLWGVNVRRMGVLLDITDRKKMEEDLRESEERFRMMANTAPVLIWMSGTDKLCNFFNKGWLDFTGRTLEQELGNGWTEGVHGDDLARCMEIYTSAFDARREFSMEYRLRRFDGEYRWVLDHGVPRLEPGGVFLGYIGTATDITEIKRGEEKFRLAVEASPSAIVMADSQGRIVLVNARTEALFGYSREELIGQAVEILVPDRFRRNHPGDRAHFAAAPEARSMGGGRDLYARRKDGSEVLVEIGLNPIRTPEGLLILTSILDISARKQAEEALKKERAFLRQVIDVVPNFIFAKDRAGRFTLANEAIAEAYGTTVDELIGKTDADFNTNAEEIEFFRRMDLEVIDTLKERFIPEERVTDSQGKVRWLQTVKRPLLEKVGFANQVLGASTDISERKKAEAELQRNRDELAHMTRVSTLGELTASLTHELNQPLGAILSNADAAEMLLMEEPPAVHEVREILADIRNDDRRASEVIRGLRSLLRKQEINRETLQINDAVAEVLRLLSIDAAHRKVVLEFTPGESLPVVEADRVKLQQVVLNLVMNAIEATADLAEDRRRVSVASRRDNGTITIDIVDHGHGVPTEMLPRLFDPFFTTKKDGMGMGLSIARTIIESHGGKIWAENNPEGGATFYFTLPVRDEAREG
jgi:PAS domain S-box-containing protein